jgi:hypothetical protein
MIRTKNPCEKHLKRTKMTETDLRNQETLIKQVRAYHGAVWDTEVLRCKPINFLINCCHPTDREDMMKLFGLDTFKMSLWPL